MSILLIAEHDNKQVSPATLSALTACEILAHPVTVVVAGHQCEHVAVQVCHYSAVKQVLLADHACYQHALAENLTELLLPFAKESTHVVAAATTFGKNLMPRLAALLDVGQVSDMIEVLDGNTFRRPVYAGNAIATVRAQDRIVCLTVRPTAFEPAQAEGSAQIEYQRLDQIVENTLTEFVGKEVHASERPDLATAEIVVSGGRGLTQEGFAELAKIADRLGAAIGASRAAVDAGLMPNDHQVGQTGKVVAPKLYIAVGISGAIQHLAGMKESKVIVAINKDADAPIFQIADYGLVADVTKLWQEWHQALNDIGISA